MRALLLFGFVTHLALGTTCFAQMVHAATSQEDDQASIETQGPMTKNNGFSCPFYKELSAETISMERAQGGCPNGQCEKISAPGAAGFAYGSPSPVDAAVLPVALAETERIINGCDPDSPFAIDDPPIPPGIRSVVLRR